MSTAFLGIMKDLTDTDLRLALEVMRESLTPATVIGQAERAAENRRVKTASEGRNKQPIRVQASRVTLSQTGIAETLKS